MWSQYYRNKKRDSKIEYFYWIHQAFSISMKKTISIKEEQICFLLDNSSVHCSSDVRSYLCKIGWSWIFLPQYTPEMAPVELFFCQLKRSISSRRNHEIVNLDSLNGRKFLIESICSIDKIAIMEIWRHFISKLKESIGELDSIFELNS